MGPRPRVAVVLALMALTYVNVWWLGIGNVPKSDGATLEYVGGGQVSTGILFGTRLVASAFFLHRIIMVTLVRSTKLQLAYIAGTQFKLKERTIDLGGLRRFVTFTMWCWCVQCLYFCLATLASWKYLHRTGSRQLGLPLLRLTHILFEISWSASHLVTTVTTYVLVPATFQNYYSKDLPAIMQRDQIVLHNANVFFANLDAILGNMRLLSAHMPTAGLFCCAYVSFIWIVGSIAGFVPYFFLDYSLPFRTAMFHHFGLFLLLLGFFQAGASLTYTATWARTSTRIHPYYLASLFWFRAALHASLFLAIACVRPPKKFRSLSSSPPP